MKNVLNVKDVVDHCPLCGQLLPKEALPQVDMETNIVIYQGKAIGLTASEAGIVEMLIKRYPRIVERGVILDSLNQLRNIEHDTDQKIIDVWVCKLRPRLKRIGLNIQTIWGKGYRLGVNGHEKS